MKDMFTNTTNAPAETMTLEKLTEAMHSLKHLKLARPMPRIFTNAYLTERVQYSRSPARAERRMKKGYPQHFITRPMQNLISPDGVNYYGHPVVVDALMKELEKADLDMLLHGRSVMQNGRHIPLNSVYAQEAFDYLAKKETQ